MVPTDLGQVCSMDSEMHTRFQEVALPASAIHVQDGEAHTGRHIHVRHVRPASGVCSLDALLAADPPPAGHSSHYLPHSAQVLQLPHPLPRMLVPPLRSPVPQRLQCPLPCQRGSRRCRHVRPCWSFCLHLPFGVQASARTRLHGVEPQYRGNERRLGRKGGWTSSGTPTILLPHRCGLALLALRRQAAEGVIDAKARIVVRLPRSGGPPPGGRAAPAPTPEAGGPGHPSAPAGPPLREPPRPARAGVPTPGLHAAPTPGLPAATPGPRLLRQGGGWRAEGGGRRAESGERRAATDHGPRATDHGRRHVQYEVRHDAGTEHGSYRHPDMHVSLCFLAC